MKKCITSGPELFICMESSINRESKKAIRSYHSAKYCSWVNLGMKKFITSRPELFISIENSINRESKKAIRSYHSAKYCTVMPTKSDSDVLISLQLLIKH